MTILMVGSHVAIAEIKNFFYRFSLTQAQVKVGGNDSFFSGSDILYMILSFLIRFRSAKTTHTSANKDGSYGSDGQHFQTPTNEEVVFVLRTFLPFCA